MEGRLTDHSALAVQLAVAPAGLLPTTDPKQAGELAPVLF
jgi:hypothetical protein